jgi:hypothetical protein
VETEAGQGSENGLGFSGERSRHDFDAPRNAPGHPSQMNDAWHFGTILAQVGEAFLDPGLRCDG